MFIHTARATCKITLGAGCTSCFIGTVGPRRPPKRVHNSEVRTREYLTNAEVDRLMKAAGTNRNGHRDATMVLVAYRHGLRPIELVTLPRGRRDLVDTASKADIPRSS